MSLLDSFRNILSKDLQGAQLVYPKDIEAAETIQQFDVVYQGVVAHVLYNPMLGFKILNAEHQEADHTKDFTELLQRIKSL